jgi:hypothetical protein
MVKKTKKLSVRIIFRFKDYTNLLVAVSGNIKTGLKLFASSNSSEA